MVSHDFFKSIIISPSDFIVEKDRVWFAHAEINVLFSMDRATGNLNYEGSFQELPFVNEPPLFAKIISYGDLLYFIPWNAKRIYIYNKLEHKFINSENYIFSLNPPYMTAIKKDETIFCIPYYLSGNITVINLQDGNVNEDVRFSNNGFLKANYISDAIIVDETLYCCMGDSREILKYNLSDGNKEIIRIEREIQSILYSCCCLNQKLYVFEEETGIIYVLNMTDYSVMDKIKTPYKKARIYCYGSRYLVIDPFDDLKVEIRDVFTNTVKEIRYHYSSVHFPFIWNRLIGCFEMDEYGKGYYCNGVSNRFYELSNDSEYEIRLSNDEISELMSKTEESITIDVSETIYYGIRDFLQQAF